MESERFDRLTQGAFERASRRGVMRAGAGALAAAALISLGLRADDAEAKKRKKPVCLNGQTKNVRNRKRFLKKNPTAVSGACTAPAQRCTTAAPVSCDPNGNWCCPSTLPTCCPDASDAGFACNPANHVCCGTDGVACAPTGEQCCAGGGRQAEFPESYCAPTGHLCCPFESEIGACSTGDFCCPPIGGTDAEGGCCPAFEIEGEAFTGGCCNPEVMDPCPEGWVCSTSDEFAAGCCIPQPV